MSLISVIVPSRNSAQFLRGTLASVLQQKSTYELLVVDSGSTDQSVEIVQQLAPQATLIQKPAGSLASALNLGIQRSRGDYLQFLEPGSELAPTMLRTQLRCLKENPADICYGGFQYFTESEDGTRVFGQKTLAQSLPNPITALLNTTFPMVSLLFTRDICQRAGKHREDLTVLLHQRFLFDCADVGARFVVSDDVAGYCRAPLSETPKRPADGNDAHEHFANCAQIMDRWLGRGQLSEDKRQALREAFVPCARYAAAQNPALFAEIAQRYRSLGGTFAPDGSLWLRALAQLFGYPQAEKLSLLLRGKPKVSVCA